MDFLHTEKRLKYYNQVIEIYKQTGYSGYRIQKLGLVPLDRKCIQKWINNFVAENSKSTLQVMKQTNQNPDSDELKALRKQISDLEEQLRQEKLRNRLNEKIIDIAEERWHIEIRKKAGTKQ